jgi:hypothetical protein
LIDAYETLCIATGIFPEHTYEKIDALYANMEKQLSLIGAAARKAEAEDVKTITGEVIQNAHAE